MAKQSENQAAVEAKAERTPTYAAEVKAEHAAEVRAERTPTYAAEVRASKRKPASVARRVRPRTAAAVSVALAEGGDAKSEAQAAAAEAKRAAKAGETLWIVNPGGALHLVSREHAREKFREVGWRKATAAEIAELDKRKGNQRFDDPIAEPWSPEPVEEGLGDAELDR